MKAVILAAGRSRRLFPITHRKPKCLLPINGIPLIDRLIHILENEGVREIVMVIGFRARILQSHVTLKHPDVAFTFIENTEYATTMPAYGLWMAREHLNQDILYLNSDILCDPKIIQEIIEYKEDSVTAVQKTKWDEEEVNVVVDISQKVTEIGKHLREEESHGEFLGVTKLGKKFNRLLVESLIAFERSEDRKRFAADALNSAIQRGGILYAHDVSKYTACEIDTVEDYENAKLLTL